MRWGRRTAELLREDSYGHNPQHASIPLQWLNNHCGDQTLHWQASKLCRSGLECLRQEPHKHDSHHWTMEKSTGCCRQEIKPKAFWMVAALVLTLISNCRAGMKQGTFPNLVRLSAASSREGEKGFLEACDLSHWAKVLLTAKCCDFLEQQVTKDWALNL